MIPCLAAEEVPEDDPDEDYRTKEKDLLLPRCDQGLDDICGDKKFQPENYFSRKLAPYRIVRWLFGSDLLFENRNDRKDSSVYDQESADAGKEISYPMDDLLDHEPSP